MTLTELLVGASVMTLVSGAALSAVLPLQRAFAAQPEASSLTQRSRVVAEMLSGDLRRATLVLPLRAGDIDNDIPAGVFYRPDIVTVLTDPVDALARGLVTPSDSRTYHLKQDGEGIWQLMQYDGRASDQPAVEDVTALTFEYFGEAEPPLPLGSQRMPRRKVWPRPVPRKSKRGARNSPAGAVTRRTCSARSSACVRVST